MRKIITTIFITLLFCVWAQTAGYANIKINEEAFPLDNLYIIGTFCGWNWSSEEVITMTHVSTYTFSTVTYFAAAAEFKFSSTKDWIGNQFSAAGDPTVPDNEEENVYDFESPGGNITIAAAGNYSIRVDMQTEKIYISKLNPVNYSNIRINEVSGVGGDAAKFYELINLGDEPVNLGGVQIFYNANDKEGQMFPPYNDCRTWTGNNTQVIPAGGLFSLIGRDNPAGTNPGSFTTGLTASRILIITLKSPNGNVIDQCIRARDTEEYNVGNIKSFSRIPDGTGPFYFTNPTPNASNGTSAGGLTLVPQTPEYKEPENLYDHTVFDLSALPTITLEVSVAEWNTLLANYDQNPGNEEKSSANFTFSKNGEDTKLTNIAFRLRGNTSRRRPEISDGGVHDPVNPVWRNAHFAFDFREFEKDQRLFGLRKLNLKWHNNDPMFCREIYSYDLFAKFGVWTAPRASYAKFYIKVGEGKPAYFGIYAMVEQVDETYLADRRASSHLETNNGNLWKCLYTSGSNGGPAGLTLDDALDKMGAEDVSLYEELSKRYSYDLKTNKANIETAKTEFYTWLTYLNSLTGNDFKTWISENMDVDLFLKTYAVNVAVGMWDDYWGNANNYYLYFEKSSGKVLFIPYDYDNALGTTWGAFDAGREDVLRWGGSNSRPLINKILAIPEYNAQYLAYLKDLIASKNNLFHVDKSIARIQTWHNLIKNHLQSDCIETTEASKIIEDRPAYWSDIDYKLLERGERNFFEAKTAAIQNYVPVECGIKTVHIRSFYSGDALAGVNGEKYLADNGSGTLQWSNSANNNSLWYEIPVKDSYTDFYFKNVGTGKYIYRDNANSLTSCGDWSWNRALLSETNGKTDFYKFRKIAGNWSWATLLTNVADANFAKVTNKGAFVLNAINTLHTSCSMPAWNNGVVMGIIPDINNAFTAIHLDIVGTNVENPDCNDDSGIENIKNNTIKIYPNPTKEMLLLENEKLTTEDYIIFNVAGQIFMQGKLSGRTTAINVESLASGIYLIKAGYMTGKFVKE